MREGVWLLRVSKVRVEGRVGRKARLRWLMAGGAGRQFVQMKVGRGWESERSAVLSLSLSLGGVREALEGCE